MIFFKKEERWKKWVVAEHSKLHVFGQPITDLYQSEDIMLFCHPFRNHLTHTEHSLAYNSLRLLSRTEYCQDKCWYIYCNICCGQNPLFISLWWLSRIKASHKNVNKKGYNRREQLLISKQSVHFAQGKKKLQQIQRIFFFFPSAVIDVYMWPMKASA